jgi:16S rRNA (uracil1498-N3)-methyltransferase
MPAMASLVRIFVNQDLKLAGRLELQAGQLHYLRNVMRLVEGDRVALFNGRNGEFLAEIIEIRKKVLWVSLIEQTRQQIGDPDIWLLFAPVKKNRINMIVEKATELGVAKLFPVLTDYTNTERVKIDSLKANAIEAAEQCRRLTIPEIKAPQALSHLLNKWDPARRLLVMDETAAATEDALKMSDLRAYENPLKIPSDAILVGPEGGFSLSELDLLSKLPFVIKINLGLRILRSETAALVALALWNELVSSRQ